MENRQTAVEWLMANLTSLFVDDSGHYKKLFEQAKAMEREQLIEAYTIGSYDMAEKEFRPEQYYQETYVNSKPPPGAHCEEA